MITPGKMHPAFLWATFTPLLFFANLGGIGMFTSSVLMDGHLQGRGYFISLS